MELSKRLTAVVNLVTKGNRVADIGCDHGYVSIYLRTHEISPKVIALDVNKGPLAKAKEHMIKYGCSEIQLRLSNGMEQLDEGEVDTIICAGMGGRLILEMFQNRMEYARSLRECILQPQSEVGMVRRQLVEWGYTIEAEDMVYEDGKYYPMLRIVGNQRTNELEESVDTEVAYAYGPLLLANRHPCLKQYLVERMDQYGRLSKELSGSNATDTQKNRVNTLHKELALIKKAMKYYE